MQSRKAFRTFKNTTNTLADSSRLRSINSGLNLSPVMYSVNKGEYCCGCLKAC